MATNRKRAKAKDSTGEHGDGNIAQPPEKSQHRERPRPRHQGLPCRKRWHRLGDIRSAASGDNPERASDSAHWLQVEETNLDGKTLYLLRVADERESEEAMGFIWKDKGGLRLTPDWSYTDGEVNKSFEMWLSGH